ncbi:MAG: GNAT family N-acetyltransferase [Erythrobacter sp.]
MIDWSLRLARAEDAPVMAALAERICPAPCHPRSDQAAPEYFARLIRKGHCLAARVGDQPAGFLANEPFRRELHLWQLAVLPELRGRGIGAGLVRASLIDARNAGLSSLTLTTSREEACGAAFFAQLGFEEVTALDAHPRLAGELANEADDGWPPESRCAMICFLD